MKDENERKKYSPGACTSLLHFFFITNMYCSCDAAIVGPANFKLLIERLYNVNVK